MLSSALERQQASNLLQRRQVNKELEPIEKRQDSKPIVLMTDSASDLPPEITGEKNIIVIPLTIEIDGQKLRDGEDISPERFYQLLQQSRSFPKTFPPSLEDFQELYCKNIGHADILGIFISKRVSKTCNIAKRAVMNNYSRYQKTRNDNPGMSPKFKIEIVDSNQVSMGTGLLVLEAAERLAAGWSLEIVKAHIQQLARTIQVSFMVDNLEYLARGGQIGRGSAFLGNFLGIKPILGLAEGGIDTKSRFFGGKRGYCKFIEYMKKDLSSLSSNFKIGICHAGAPEKAARIKEMIDYAFPGQHQIISWFGPTVGAHLGPGAVGVAWLSSGETV